MNLILRLYKIGLKLLFPLRCPVCDEPVPWREGKICRSCRNRLRYVAQPRCMKCGKGLADSEREYCFDCAKGRHLFAAGRALYEYDGAAASIYRFKYGGRREYADFYGEEICRHLGEFIRRMQPDALVPIPLHRSRERRRGYNQAKLLAEAIGRYSGIPVREILLRVKKTAPLKRLNPEERQNNLKNAFLMRENEIKLKRVILIDDIYTTGSTVDEAARVLLASGAEKVCFIALACGAGL